MCVCVYLECSHPFLHLCVCLGSYDIVVPLVPSTLCVHHELKRLFSLSYSRKKEREGRERRGGGERKYIQ